MAIVAYKAFKKGLIATRGKGIYQYSEGINLTESASCAKCGFHCAEDPLDMFTYYQPGPNTEYRIVIAAGDVDEDGNDSKISCTKLIVKSEITIDQVAVAALIFWQKHPNRSREHFELPGHFKMECNKWPTLQGKKGELLCFAIGNKKAIEKINILKVDGKVIKEDKSYDINGNEVRA